MISLHSAATRWVRYAALAPVLFLLGCGSWGTVEGTVDLDGSPLKKANIAFNPVGEGASAYGSVVDGKFKVATGDRAGLKPGEYVVTVVEQTIPEEGSKNPVPKLLTPAKYATRDKSDLRTTIKDGVNKIDLKMTSK